VMFTLAELESVIPVVRASVPPTPQYAWPLLKSRTGMDVVVKHENHTPIGSFKVRGGLVYFDRLKRRHPKVRESSPQRAEITANRWPSPDPVLGSP
jgi:threonine dehydratase